MLFHASIQTTVLWHRHPWHDIPSLLNYGHAPKRDNRFAVRGFGITESTLSSTNDRPKDAPAQDPPGVAPVAHGPVPGQEVRATDPVGTPPSPGSLEAAISTGFPVVGIGASAGGLAAFEAFFSGMPAETDPGMAFVLVQHLAPHHKSLLSELVRRYTRMEVFEVEDGMVVRPNCTYIIPPNHDMAFLNGALQLLEPVAPRGQRLPIDFLFRSLALDQRERAIGIVLSGTGSDGSQGARAIKSEGGMVMAQSIATCEFDGMPRSVLATGLVDYELPPAEMPARLVAYVAHAFGIWAGTGHSPAPESAMRKVFVLLRTGTGHDFSQYKPSTIRRRIERRMAVHQIEAMDGYVKYLQQTPAEVEALFRDLLIGVTSFFRDPEAFGVLETEVVPKLFAARPAGAVIRVWSAGCSTGEEAYSLAMLLQERIEALKLGHTAQVFATDIDGRAIASARAGLYPTSVAADLPPERLARFFTAEPDGTGYRIRKGVRDMMVFSEQDVIKDPPFSKLDLICCRNLMIYLGSDLQKKLILLFHYALNPGGFLFLGTSEGVGEFDDLFAAVDRKSKLYARRDDARRPRPGTRYQFPASGAALPHGAAQPAGSEKPALREVTEQALLRHVAPAGALVTARGDVLYLHGRTGLFLEPPPGETGTLNILKMAREGLRSALTEALHKATRTTEPVRGRAPRVRTNSHFTTVDVTIRLATADPTAAPDARLYLVVLEDVPAARPEPAPPGTVGEAPAADGEARVAALLQELGAKEESLQSMNEELETSTEELKSSNEEMQSVNEELQSTNEELETSKEELQSVNEELATVNAELQTRVADLTRTNNDMNNLLAGTGIGTVFVDLRLRVLRFTPAASAIINLIPGDVGRPVAHIVSNLVNYDRLVPDVQAVLDTLVPREVDVLTRDGKTYTLRIQPYRTLDNVIEGAVLSFVDVTETVRIRDELHRANDLSRLAVVVHDAYDAVTVQDLDGHTLAWNPGAVRMYGWTEAEALLLNVRERVPADQRDATLARLDRLSRAEILEPFRTHRVTKQGTLVEVSITATRLVNETGRVYAFAATERAVEGGAP